MGGAIGRSFFGEGGGEGGRRRSSDVGGIIG